MRNLKKMPESAGLEPVTGLTGDLPVSHLRIGSDSVTLGAVVYTGDGQPARHETQTTGLRRVWHS